MQEIIQYLHANPIIYKSLLSFIILLTYLKLISIINKLLFKALKETQMYYTTRKRLYYLHSVILLVIFIMLWSEGRMDLTIYIGFISAGIAITLREIFTNIAALLLIVIQKPFEIGDRIMVQDRTGDVIDQKIFHFVMMEVSSKQNGEQSTGKIVHIPNNYIFLHPVTNANRGFAYIWNEMTVRLSLDSDWESAKAALETILNNHAKHFTSEAKNKVTEAAEKYMLQFENLEPVVYMTVHEGMLQFSLRFLTEPRNARDTEVAIWQDVLQQAKEQSETFKLA